MPSSRAGSHISISTCTRRKNKGILQIALGCTAGAGPYKTWEKQPLCDEHGGASSSSADEDYYNDKEQSGGSIVSRKTLQYLVWFNAALFLLVVIGGTLMVSPLKSSCMHAASQHLTLCK